MAVHRLIVHPRNTNADPLPKPYLSVRYRQRASTKPIYHTQKQKECDNHRRMDAPVRKKLVIVGDGACGKTSLLMYFPAHIRDSMLANRADTCLECLREVNFR